ncbi:C2 calcium-dependent domain-containing protein 4D-like [Latimeria chalumnae]|uniref:C2 calcium-dependent domain-containing protein 4D-like n=1 Tax=Latimeria chalumnae TaxID=7897 RepID=UPI0003C13932|nr:PREDICTED: C2 calcium-dependent domain-containing protein 4D-like [Latimeria chalumnae]|eukprot:XP_006013824.1 PREDICTED: C2 calcium-dependent domain-containing protein 4D-like [Latimeria chalumnae]
MFLEKLQRSVEDLTRVSSDSVEDKLGVAMFWLNQKTAGSRSNKTSPCPNVLTPDRIPEFFIPPKLSVFKVNVCDEGLNFQEEPKVTRGAKWVTKGLVYSGQRHIIQIENVDQDSNNSEEETEQRLQSAYSMPHLAQAAGFTFLAESPHTRRRESLFHAKCPLHKLMNSARKQSFENLAAPESPPVSNLRVSSPDMRPPRSFCKPSIFGNLDSDTASSTESSPFSSPLLTRSLAGTLVCQAYSRQRLFCRMLNTKVTSRAGSLSTDDVSSSDNSPNISRKGNKTGMLTQSCATLAPPPLYHFDFICCHERLTKESSVDLSKGGKLRLFAEYIQENSSLRIRLINAEGLYRPSFNTKNIHCCCTLYLQPGRLQKQRSTIIKNSRNPIFNEDFFFEGVSQDDLTSKSIKIKVINKSCSIKRNFLLGECELQLCSILPSS